MQMVSFCYHTASVVVINHASIIINFCFKLLLLLNLKVDKNSCQESSMHKALSIYWKNPIPCRTWVAMATKEKSLKILVSESTGARAKIFGLVYHLVVLYQNWSDYIPGVKATWFYIGLYRGDLKDLLWNHKAMVRIKYINIYIYIQNKIFFMEHHTGSLSRLFK